MLTATSTTLWLSVRCVLAQDRFPAPSPWAGPALTRPGPQCQRQRKCFVKAIDEALENLSTDCATARWDFIRDAVYKAAIGTFGKRAKNNEAGIEEMERVIAVKGAALLEYKRQPCEMRLAAYRQAWSNEKRISRNCADDYWLKHPCHVNGMKRSPRSQCHQDRFPEIPLRDVDVQNWTWTNLTRHPSSMSS